MSYREDLFSKEKIDKFPELEEVIAFLLYSLLTSKLIAKPWEAATQKANPSEDNPYFKEYMEGHKWFSEDVTKEEWYEVYDDENHNIHAFFIRNPVKSNKIAIVNHGYRTLSKKVGPWAKIFFDAGYNILAPSFRSSSLSEGNQDVSFGYYESEDNVIWINRLLKEFGEDSHIVLHGMSMGASTDMMTMGKTLPANVKGFIADCGYGQIRPLLYGITRLLINNLPIQSNVIDIDKVMESINSNFVNNQNITIDDVSPLEQVKKATVPLLIISGDEDVIVSVETSEKIISEAPEGSKLVLFKGAPHSDSLVTDYPLYVKTVHDFLNAIIKE